MYRERLLLGWGRVVQLCVLFVATLLDYGHFWLFLLPSAERRSADVQSIPLRDGNITEESVLWLQDARDGLCLGPHGFGQCGDVNLWRVWRATDGMFRLEHVSGVHDSYEPLSNASIFARGGSDSDRHCFARYFTLRGSESSVGLTRCSELPYRASTRWVITADGRLASPMMGSSYCLRRLGGGSTAITAPCSRTDLPDFAVLSPVVHLAVIDAPSEPRQPSGSEATDGPSTSSEGNDGGAGRRLRCSKTGLVFPGTLHAMEGPQGEAVVVSGGGSSSSSSDISSSSTGDKGNVGVPSALLVGPSEGSRLDFFGMGTYSKRYIGINVNVYTVALYASAAGLLNDNRIVSRDQTTSRGISTSSSSSSSSSSTSTITSGVYRGDGALFDALSGEAAYDRGLYIQLALSVGKDTLMQGLVEDLPLSKDNKERMLSIASKLDLSTCPRGLTLLFLWRGTSSTTCPGCVDMFIDGQFLDRVRDSDLGRDFFHQFVCDDPVSLEAKQAFAHAVRQSVESGES